MEAETTLNTRLLGFSVSLWRQVVSLLELQEEKGLGLVPSKKEGFDRFGFRRQRF